jgi:hypothetical protein
VTTLTPPRLETSRDPPACEAGVTGCRTGGQVARSEVTPLRKARLAVRRRAIVDTADCGSRDYVLNESAAGAAFSADEAKPRSQPPAARPRQDETVHVRITSLPGKRRRRVRPCQRRIELQDSVSVGPAVRVRQPRHSVGRDERTVVTTGVGDPADPPVVSRPIREGNGAPLLRIIAKRDVRPFTRTERANGDPHRLRPPADHVVLVPPVDARPKGLGGRRGRRAYCFARGRAERGREPGCDEENAADPSCQTAPVHEGAGTPVHDLAVKHSPRVTFPNRGADELALARLYPWRMRRAADIVLTLSIGVCVGILIGYLLGFTHGAPTPENSSPPPEAFDYPFGILVGVLAVAVARAVGPSVWGSTRSRRRAD